MILGLNPARLSCFPLLTTCFGGEGPWFEPFSNMFFFVTTGIYDLELKVCFLFLLYLYSIQPCAISETQ